MPSYSRTAAHPVVREVLVYDLPHLGLLVVEDVGSKVEDDVEHAGLGCQGGTAVLGVGVGRDLGGGGRGRGGRERGRGGEGERGEGERGRGGEGRGGEGERGRGGEGERGEEERGEGERGRGGRGGGGRGGGGRGVWNSVVRGVAGSNEIISRVE